MFEYSTLFFSSPDLETGKGKNFVGTFLGSLSFGIQGICFMLNPGSISSRRKVACFEYSTLFFSRPDLETGKRGDFVGTFLGSLSFGIQGICFMLNPGDTSAVT